MKSPPLLAFDDQVEGLERSPATGRWTARFVLDDGAVERIELGAEVVTDDEAWAAFAALERARAR